MSTVSLPTSLRTSAPRLSAPIGEFAVSFVRWLARTMQRPKDTPAEAAARVRELANQFAAQPSFAADLRAAADRHEQEHGIV